MEVVTASSLGVFPGKVPLELMGKPWENDGLMGFHGMITSWETIITIEQLYLQRIYPLDKLDIVIFHSYFFK